MKNKYTYFLISAICLLSFNSFSVNYVSAGSGPANWNDASSWSPSGIPSTSDDVTILTGHTINISSSGNKCRSLSLSGTLNWTTVSTLIIYGNYSILSGGNESGVAGRVQLNGLGGNILTCTGSASPTVHYYFYRSYSIAAGSDVNKINATTFIINSGAVVTNLGTYRAGTTDARSGTSWINGPNSTLFIHKSGFMNGRPFTASASGNNVNLLYSAGTIPPTTSGYFNLSLISTVAGIKSITVNTVVANDLTVNTLNTFNSNNFDLTIRRNWINNGTFTGLTGNTVLLDGNVTQTISGNGNFAFKELTVNNINGVTITGGTYILDEVLTIVDGTFNTGGRPFTMTSTASQTARIAPITGFGAIAGNFTIERFITGRDTTWADLSSPVQNATFIDWDNELPAIYYGNFPTQYTYNETADDFTPVTNSGTALTPGQGFEVFMSNDFAYSDFAARAINTVGVPNQGDQDLTGLISFNNAGSNLVGNPFASSISWDAVFANSSGIEATYDVYDFASGNYATFGAGTEIGATQGFWVYTNTAAATLLIPESSKTTSSNSSIRSTIAEPYFTLKLSNNDPKNNYFHKLKVSADATSSDGWDSNDHPYRRSPNKLAPSMYTTVDGKKAVINSFNADDDNFSMPVAVNANAGSYRIEAAGFENIGEFTCVKLEDTQNNSLIDLTSGEAYSFEVKANDKADRFIVHFSKSSNCKAFVELASDLENGVKVLPTAQGNSISFNMNETTPSTITVTNVLGQNVIEGMSVMASNQTIDITIPQDFSGMYIIKIESPKGVITKKYVRK